MTASVRTAKTIPNPRHLAAMVTAFVAVVGLLVLAGLLTAGTSSLLTRKVSGLVQRQERPDQA